MAAPALPIHVGPEQLITVKVLYNYSNRRFKLPLKDLKAEVFPEKVNRPHSSSDRTASPPPALIMIVSSTVWVRPWLILACRFTS